MVYYCLATQLLGRRQLLVKHNISGKSMGNFLLAALLGVNLCCRWHGIGSTGVGGLAVVQVRVSASRGGSVEI